MLGSSRSSAEVAVELPFTVVFEPPSQDELRAVMRMRGLWVAGLLVALAIGAWVVLASVRRAEAIVGDTAVSLQLMSRPDGARVWLDGREQGPAPLAVQVGPGLHNL